VFPVTKLPVWVLRVAEVAARAVPPLMRALGSKRAALDAEERKRAIREEIERRVR
jgi:hypothetical protein